MSVLALTSQQNQHQNFSPRLQKAVKLLHLPTTDFNRAIEIALGDNPFLESVDPALAPEPAPLLASESLTAIAVSLHGERSDAPGHEFVHESIHDLANDLTHDAAHDAGDGAAWSFSAYPGPKSSSGEHGERNALDLMAAPTTLHEHLHAQLRLLRLSDRDFLLASVLVESLDDDGYLRTDLNEINTLAGLSPPADAQELSAALHRVQSLEPAGVGARHLAECLRLQLPAIESEAERALCAAVLALPPNKLKQLNIAQISNDLQRPQEQVERALQQLRRLDPHPGWRHGDQPARYIVPDVLVRKSGGRWQAVLNEAVMPKVRFNGRYADALRRDDAARNHALSAQLNEARWTLRHVDQRFSTILSVAQSILKRQQRFLEYGPVGMRPLGLREIADEVGVHESTVSRVTNNKYMATPSGVFELKYFFSRGMPTRTGQACSPIAVRGLVREIIAGELPSQPMSDVAIANQLQRQGISVARRTVTKYRQQLGIKPADRRGQSAAGAT
jgi:RNA polymerase sigma-54 factor